MVLIKKRVHNLNIAEIFHAIPNLLAYWEEVSPRSE